MSRPAWGTAPIRCGKMRCKFRGFETDLVEIPHKTIDMATSKVCPTCGCTEYMFMTPDEIKAWERNKNQAAPSSTTKEYSA